MNTMKVKDLYSAVVDGKIISDIELQRAIVYDAAKQELVIDSIVNGIPLPAFYLWKNDDGILEVLDGKQRIEAIKKFKQGNLQYKGKTWKAYAYDSDIQSIIDETELTIIECSGDEDKKREIFKRINTLGVPLSKYEVLNGLFHGVYLDGLNDYFANDSTVRKVLPNEATDRGNNKYRLLEYILQLSHNLLTLFHCSTLLYNPLFVVTLVWFESLCSRHCNLVFHILHHLLHILLYMVLLAN